MWNVRLLPFILISIGIENNLKLNIYIMKRKYFSCVMKIKCFSIDMSVDMMWNICMHFKKGWNSNACSFVQLSVINNVTLHSST